MDTCVFKKIDMCPIHPENIVSGCIIYYDERIKVNYKRCFVLTALIYERNIFNTEVTAFISNNNLIVVCRYFIYDYIVLI